MKVLRMAFAALACLLSSGLAFAGEATYELTIDADGTLTGWTGTLPEELVLPDTVTNIGAAVFADCVDQGDDTNTWSLLSVTLPANLKSVGEGAFKGCTKLERVEVSTFSTWRQISFADETANPLSLGATLYVGGIPLEINGDSQIDVKILDGVIDIPDRLFAGCAELVSVAFPSSLASVGESAFETCVNLKRVDVQTYAAWRQVVFANEAANPLTLGATLCVSGIPLEVSGDSRVEVIISDDVSTIPANLFAGCGDIASVKLPKNLVSIGDSAFADCTGLTNIELPDSVMSIGGSAFANCSDLESVTVPASVTNIGESAFWKCVNLREVTLPENLLTISPFVFYGCSSLESVAIPSFVVSIGESAFHGCSSLTTVGDPSGLQSIGRGAFRDCEKLQSITLPSSLKKIYIGAFANCKSLDSIAVPGGVSVLGEYAQTLKPWSMVTTTTVTTDTSSEASSDSLSQNGGTSTIASSSSQSVTQITSISSSAPSVFSQNCGVFEGCDRLHSVTIGEDISEIGYRAFAGCAKMKMISIPECVTVIDAGAFANCTALSELTLPSQLVSLGETETVPVASGKKEITTTMRSVTNTVTQNGGASTLSSSTTCSSEGSRDSSSMTIMSNGDAVTTNYSSVVSLDGGVFDRCVNLKKIQIPETVESIGNHAFENCVSLQTVEFLGDEPEVGGYDIFLGTPSSLIVEVKKDAWWYDPVTFERYQSWHGRTVSYEGERMVPMSRVEAVDIPSVLSNTFNSVLMLGASLTESDRRYYQNWARNLIDTMPIPSEKASTVYVDVVSAYVDFLSGLDVLLSDEERSSLQWWILRLISKSVTGGGLVVTNGTSSGSSSGTGSSPSGGVVAQTVAANLTVTNVVVHYVQEVENVASVATATPGGLVAVVSEVLGSSAMAIPSSWTNSYPQFVEMFGDDFASALMKPSGKVGSDGAALQVWQDYVAGTDPTDPTSRFSATIDFVDGTPVVTWSPNVADGSRVYTIWGKKSLGDADWTQIDAATTADYNFFKVTVEMK